jgi:hypothetical protein
MQTKGARKWRREKSWQQSYWPVSQSDQFTSPFQTLHTPPNLLADIFQQIARLGAIHPVLQPVPSQ